LVDYSRIRGSIFIFTQFLSGLRIFLSTAQNTAFHPLKKAYQ
jgi:hypothetical protein